MRPGKTETGAAIRGAGVSLLNRITGVSLFIKVMGIALSLIALFGAETIIQTRALMRDSLKKETNERSRLLAEPKGRPRRW